MQMLQRCSRVIRRGAVRITWGLVLAGAALACSGPPPPSITILPTTVDFEYYDEDGTLQSAPTQELIRFDDPNAIGAEYLYCGDPAAKQSMCFDYGKRMAMIEVPAGASLSFGAFQYNPPSSAPTGRVNRHLDTVQAMINRIASTNGGRSMSINEMQTRGTSGAFEGLSGIKAMMILDWAEIDPDDTSNGLPPGYKLNMVGAPSFNDVPANPYSGNFGAFHPVTGEPDDGNPATTESPGNPNYNMNLVANPTPSLQRWYTPLGNYGPAGGPEDSRTVVRMVAKHMAADAAPEAWIWLENETGDNIDQDGVPNELGRLHVWVQAAGYMRTNGGRIGLSPSQPPTSRWNFDIPPANTSKVPRNPFRHVSFTGRPNDEIGFPAHGRQAGDEFEIHDIRYEVPSEPGGYRVSADVDIYWAYGTEMGSPHWEWTSMRKYFGFVDLTGWDVDKSSPMGQEIRRRIRVIQSQLRCIQGDVNSGPHNCTYETDSGIQADLENLEYTIGSVAYGGGSFPSSDVLDVLLPTSGAFGPVPSTAAATSYLDPLPDISSLGMTGIPPGFTVLNPYRYSGVFPQSTETDGKGGFAYVMVRDTKPPRHFAITEARSGSAPIENGNIANSGEAVAETGRRLADSLTDAGLGTKLDVVVFDDNPGNIAYGLHPDSPAGTQMLNQSGANVNTANGIAPLAGLVAASGTPPKVQVWYSAQKSGYDFQAGRHIGEGLQDPNGLLTMVQKRGAMLGADNLLIPQPTFRFYPFRDACDGTGAIQEYLPYRYKLVESGGEPLGVVMNFEIDLVDMCEPVGFHFARGSEAFDDGTNSYPAYNEKMLKLFVRATDSRLAIASGSTFLDIPNDAAFGEFTAGNYAPFLTPSEVEHEPAFTNATQLFPNDEDVPRTMNDVTPLRPETALGPVVSGARNYTDASGTPFQTLATEDVVSKAVGIEVKDVIPPAVVLMITDTKYDRTVFYGNSLVGDLSTPALQQNLIAGHVVPADAEVDPDMTATQDAAANPRLFPVFNSPQALPICTSNYPPTPAPCLVAPDSVGGKDWTFTYDQAGGGVTDYQKQLELMLNFNFNPTNFFADPTVLPEDCDTADPATDRCQMTTARGFWVDEDTRLILRVLAWDNLNSYLSAAPSTVAVKGGGETFENIEVAGLSGDPGIGDGDGLIDVRIMDAASGYDAGNETGLDTGPPELRQSWPTYTFRNPNRVDATGTPTGTDSYIEVKYTDPAGNSTTLRVNVFVMENNMTIRSLQEQRERELGGE